METLLNPTSLSKAIPLLVPIFSVLMPVLVVLVVMHYRHQRTVKLHETVKYLADRGMPVPRELLDPPASANRHNGSVTSPLFGALTVLGAGIGLMIFFYFSWLRHLWGIGALVTSIGAAQVIALWLARRFPQRDDVEPRGP